MNNDNRIFEESHVDIKKIYDIKDRIFLLECNLKKATNRALINKIECIINELKKELELLDVIKWNKMKLYIQQLTTKF